MTDLQGSVTHTLVGCAGAAVGFVAGATAALLYLAGRAGGWR